MRRSRIGCTLLQLGIYPKPSGRRMVGWTIHKILSELDWAEWDRWPAISFPRDAREAFQILSFRLGGRNAS